MFFSFAAWNAGQPLGAPQLPWIEDLTRVHPRVLVAALEHFFSTRTFATTEPNYALPAVLATAPYGAPALYTGINGAPPADRWDHLIYAYMIENTRIFEIFDRVIREYESGERFETPDPDTALWLRATESLFYRDLDTGFAGALTSWIRPDLRAIRRNAYYRLLGMDLNHGSDENRAYRFDKPTAANKDFPATFEMFLREVWRGVVNANNGIGPNDTDNATIAELARSLQVMLTLRRRNGNILREEFWSVVTMAWFHLAVMENTPVVRALKAEAQTPADRLRKIGERLGMAAHSRADTYFEMAFELSAVLTFIETSPLATSPASASGYYLATGPMPQIAAHLKTITTQWSLATGRDLKAIPVNVNQPARVAAGNGQLVRR
jgi:hypothetical protein